MLQLFPVILVQVRGQRAVAKSHWSGWPSASDITWKYDYLLSSWRDMGIVLRVSHLILSWMSKTGFSRGTCLSSPSVKTPQMAAVGFGDWSSKSKPKLEDFTHNVEAFSERT